MTDRVANFMRGYSIEVTPRGADGIADFRQHLPPHTWVYVTSLPGSDFSSTVATCRRLHAEGMIPVPHFTARSIKDARMLAERLDQVTSEAGVTRVLAIGGANTDIAGEFADTMSMLETGLFEKYGIESIGLAGHPEDSPALDRAKIREHAYRKIDFARDTGCDMFIVTQFSFEARPVIEFVERIRAVGNPLRLYVGLPGVATLKSLIRHAKACGVGPSMSFLTSKAKDIHRLLRIEAPDRQVRELADYIAENPGCNIAGAHIYPLGGFEKSAAWVNAIVARISAA